MFNNQYKWHDHEISYWKWLIINTEISWPGSGWSDFGDEAIIGKSGKSQYSCVKNMNIHFLEHEYEYFAEVENMNMWKNDNAMTPQLRSSLTWVFGTWWKVRFKFLNFSIMIEFNLIYDCDIMTWVFGTCLKIKFKIFNVLLW